MTLKSRSNAAINLPLYLIGMGDLLFPLLTLYP